MKTQELRIGNLVTIDNPKHHPDLKNKILVVVGIMGWREDQSIALMHIDPKENHVIPAFSQFIDFVKPIPLTFEWMTLAGFKREDDRIVGLLDMPNHEATIQRWGDNNYVSICRSGIAAYHMPCEYVHQLQNIYFPLTGEELELTISKSIERSLICH